MGHNAQAVMVYGYTVYQDGTWLFHEVTEDGDPDQRWLEHPPYDVEDDYQPRVTTPAEWVRQAQIWLILGSPSYRYGDGRKTYHAQEVWADGADLHQMVLDVTGGLEFGYSGDTIWFGSKTLSTYAPGEIQIFRHRISDSLTMELALALRKLEIEFDQYVPQFLICSKEG